MMQVKIQPDSIEILFPQATNGRANILFYTEAFVALVFSISFAVTAIKQIMSGHFLFFLFLMGACIVFGIAAWRYFTKSVKSEKMIIGPDTITLITKGANRSVRKYAVAEITDFKYTGFISAVDHPLKSQSYDYIGVETQMKVANVVNDEGNLVFSYQGTEVRFGSGIQSWDAEELDKYLRKMATGLFIKDLPEEIPDHVWQGTQAGDGETF